MNNKEKLKKVINNDFSKEKNYKEIIDKIESKTFQSNHKIWKLVLLPLCFILLFGSFYIINLNDSHITFENRNDNEANIILNINNLASVDMNKLDVDIKEITLQEDFHIKDEVHHDSDKSIYEIENLDTILVIPEDLDNFKRYGVFTKKDQNSGHDILNSLVYYYSNESKSKSIRLSFSNTNKPISAYVFTSERTKETFIDNVKLKIYKYQTLYFAEFNCKNYNFFIETNGISERELSDLLISIIN